MRIANEIGRVAVQLMPRVVMDIKRVGGAENSAYNSVHYEISRFLDTVRRNEGLSTVISRMDTDDSMRLEVGFSDHEAAKAIENELVRKTSNACSRNGIEAVDVCFADAGEEPKKGHIVFTDMTASRIWDALKKMGVVSDGMVAGDIRWQAVFFIGPAGSGKSFVRDMKYVRHLDFRVVDPDEIKTKHPDYDQDQPFKVHAWSKSVSDSMFKGIVESGEGHPVIVDGTGRNVDGVLSKMKVAKDNGYRTFVVYVYVPFEVSIFRNRNRDRFVPEDVIMEQTAKIHRNFGVLRSFADKSKVIRNFEKSELKLAKADIRVYPVPQSVRPPRPGDHDYGVKAMAASLVTVARMLA